MHAVVCLGFIIALFLFLAFYYFDFMLDDPYISFRYAENFALGNGLVFNIGERVEGYTNFLWVIMLSVIVRMRFDPVLFSKLLGILFGLATIILAYRFSKSISDDDSLFNLLASLLVSSSWYFALWSIGGLETSLFTFLVFAALYWYGREEKADIFPLSGILYALATMTRPEGGLFFATAVLHRAILRFQERLLCKKDIIWVMTFLGLYLPYFIWRFVYYGYLLPNTFYAKASGGMRQLRFGVNYVANFLGSKVGLFLRLQPGAAHLLEDFMGDMGILIVSVVIVSMPLLSLAVHRREKSTPVISLAFLSIGAYLAYVVCVGGDWMPGFRFIVPIMPIAYLLIQKGLRCIPSIRIVPHSRAQDLMVCRRGDLSKESGVGSYGRPIQESPNVPHLSSPSAKLHLSRLVCGMIISAILLSNLFLERHTLTVQAYWLSPWFRRMSLQTRSPYYEVAEWLRTTAPPDSVVALGEAGLIPYYSKLRIIDFYGLTDTQIAHLRGLLHYKSDAEYILSREPDYVILILAVDDAGIVRYAGPPMQAFLDSERFHQEYLLVKKIRRSKLGNLYDYFFIYKRLSQLSCVEDTWPSVEDIMLLHEEGDDHVYEVRNIERWKHHVDFNEEESADQLGIGWHPRRGIPFPMDGKRECRVSEIRWPTTGVGHY